MPMHIWGRGKLSVGSRQPDAGCLFVCFRLLLLLATGAAEPYQERYCYPTVDCYRSALPYRASGHVDRDASAWRYYGDVTFFWTGSMSSGRERRVASGHWSVWAILRAGVARFAFTRHRCSFAISSHLL